MAVLILVLMEDTLEARARFVHTLNLSAES